MPELFSVFRFRSFLIFAETQIMVHSTEMQHDLIARKIDEINLELTETRDGLPPITISVGIVHGSEAIDSENLFERTDEAMYKAKQSGKHTYVFN